MSQYNLNTQHSERINLKNPIDFRSDTVTLPSKEMLQSIQDASLGDDVYNEDEAVNELQSGRHRQGQYAAVDDANEYLINQIKA